MVSFNETHAPTFRNCVIEQDLPMPNWSKTFETFWLHSSIFALQKQPENLNVKSSLAFRKRLVASFTETCAPTSRKYVVERSWLPLNLSKAFKTYWLDSSVFALEKQLEKLNFHSFFTSKKPFSG